MENLKITAESFGETISVTYDDNMKDVLFSHSKVHDEEEWEDLAALTLVGISSEEQEFILAAGDFLEKFGS